MERACCWRIQVRDTWLSNLSSAYTVDLFSYGEKLELLRIGREIDSETYDSSSTPIQGKYTRLPAHLIGAGPEARRDQRFHINTCLSLRVVPTRQLCIVRLTGIAQS